MIQHIHISRLIIALIGILLISCSSRRNVANIVTLVEEEVPYEEETITTAQDFCKYLCCIQDSMPKLVANLQNQLENYEYKDRYKKSLHYLYQHRLTSYKRIHFRHDTLSIDTLEHIPIVNIIINTFADSIENFISADPVSNPELCLYIVFIDRYNIQSSILIFSIGPSRYYLNGTIKIVPGDYFFTIKGEPIGFIPSYYDIYKTLGVRQILKELQSRKIFYMEIPILMNQRYVEFMCDGYE